MLRYNDISIATFGSWDSRDHSKSPNNLYKSKLLILEIQRNIVVLFTVQLKQKILDLK